jgi:hypothetical protein
MYQGFNNHPHRSAELTAEALSLPHQGGGDVYLAPIDRNFTEVSFYLNNLDWFCYNI